MSTDSHILKRYPAYKAPTNRDIKIWRYMEFTKFVAMLDQEGLFFSRADLLGDPFEGSIPLVNLRDREKVFREEILEPMARISDGNNVFADPSTRNQAAKRWVEHTSMANRYDLQWTYINCWHMNEQESAAMWRLYSKTDEAIAIQTTYGVLRECLPADIFTGSITYLNYDTESIPAEIGFYRFTHKRKSFEHEQEVRAIFTKIPTKMIIDEETGNQISGIDWEQKNTETGRDIHVDLNALLKLVYVAPGAPIWFNRLVTRILEKYKVNCEVRQSSMDNERLY